MEHGLILVDTKYEFGKAPDGTVLLIDEVNDTLSLSLSLFVKVFVFVCVPVYLSLLHSLTHISMCNYDTILCSVFLLKVHTPDSSRYWIAHSYQERFWNGLEPENVDKVMP